MTLTLTLAPTRLLLIQAATVMDKLESIGATDILTTGLLSSRIYD